MAHFFKKNRQIGKLPSPWSSLVEGDKQLDQPKSQTCLECCHACAALYILVRHKHNSLPLGPIQTSSHTTKEPHAFRNERQ